MWIHFADTSVERHYTLQGIGLNAIFHTLDSIMKLKQANDHNEVRESTRE